MMRMSLILDLDRVPRSSQAWSIKQLRQVSPLQKAVFTTKFQRLELPLKQPKLYTQLWMSKTPN